MTRVTLSEFPNPLPITVDCLARVLCGALDYRRAVGVISRARLISGRQGPHQRKDYRQEWS